MVYARAAALALPKPILFKILPTLSPNAAAREFIDFWLVWLRVVTAEKVAHELAHIIVELIEKTPALDPREMGDASTREFLGNIVGLFEHPQVHAILRDSGLNAAEESLK